MKLKNLLHDWLQNNCRIKPKQLLLHIMTTMNKNIPVPGCQIISSNFQFFSQISNHQEAIEKMLKLILVI